MRGSFIGVRAAWWVAGMAGVLGGGVRADEVVRSRVDFEARLGAPLERLVDFDGYAHQTVLTGQYAGVAFAATGRVWDAIDFGGGGTAVSGRNVVLNFGSAPIVMSFSPPVVSVGVYNPSIFDRIRLTMKRADGSVIRTIDMETGVVTFAGYLADEPISTMEAVGILEGGGSNGTIFLDDLQWSTRCARVSDPASAIVCPEGTVTFSVVGGGVAPLRYQWQTLVGGIWCPLTDLQPGGGCRGNGGGGPSHALYRGVDGPVLTVSGASAGDEGLVRCVVTGSCGQPGVASAAAELRLCRVDFNCDAFVDFFDYDDFVTAFEAGDMRADITADGFLDFFDYDAFVEGFEVGC